MTAILETLSVYEVALSECRRLSAEIAVLEDLNAMELIFNDLYKEMNKELVALNDDVASFFRAVIKAEDRVEDRLDVLAELIGTIFRKHPDLRAAVSKRLEELYGWVG